jgi:nicotinate-nucleotide adenylyltransferase
MTSVPGLSSDARRARRLGLLGGSFDPPHRGHLHVARSARRSLDLDHVIFVPAGRNPHKRDRAVAGDEERLAMLEILLREEAGTSIWSGELTREGPSYTVDTAEILREELGTAVEIFLLLGSDNLCGFSDWRRVEDLLRLVRPVVVRRRGQGLDLAPLEGLSPLGRRRVEEGFLDLEPLDISSTELRAHLGRGEDPGDLLPDPLGEYIRRRGIYDRGG